MPGMISCLHLGGLGVIPRGEQFRQAWKVEIMEAWEEEESLILESDGSPSSPAKEEDSNTANSFNQHWQCNANMLSIDRYVKIAMAHDLVHDLGIRPDGMWPWMGPHSFPKAFPNYQTELFTANVSYVPKCLWARVGLSKHSPVRCPSGTTQS